VSAYKPRTLSYLRIVWTGGTLLKGCWEKRPFFLILIFSRCTRKTLTHKHQGWSHGGKGISADEKIMRTFHAVFLQLDGLLSPTQGPFSHPLLLWRALRALLFFVSRFSLSVTFPCRCHSRSKGSPWRLLQGHGTWQLEPLANSKTLAFCLHASLRKDRSPMWAKTWSDNASVPSPYLFHVTFFVHVNTGLSTRVARPCD